MVLSLGNCSQAQQDAVVSPISSAVVYALRSRVFLLRFTQFAYFAFFFPTQKTLFDDKVKTDGVFEAVKCLHAADTADAVNRALCIHAEDDGHALPFATSDLATVIRRMTP